MILVTGGCGFIGSNLIPMLEKLGYSIRVLDNYSTGNKENLTGSEAEIIEGDIRDQDAVSCALKNVEGVIHLAAYGSVVDSVEDPNANFAMNVTGTFTLLNECLKSGMNRIIFSSTGGALIGNAEPPVNEESVPKPISPYGASKLCCEAYCSAFSHSYDMDIIALRFANVIGPNSWHKKGAVTAFIKAIMNGEPIKIYGDGEATRDYLYVDDLCRGIISALESDLSGFNAIHLASGKETSVKNLANLVIEKSHLDSHEIAYFEKRQGEVERNFAEFLKARRLLNFEPSTSIDQAIEKTWNWFLKHIE